MRNAETILGMIRDRGTKGLPLERVYRLLFNPDLYLHAYGKIARNRGAMTPGATDETIDGMAMDKIQAIIDDLRSERYRWTPAKRVYIPKSNGKMRPLGVPSWRDKLLQEVIRAILESYYEPQFSPHSHGFRPGRGCHTALQEVRDQGRGAVWFIEGDITQCFDRLDHDILLGILAERIADGRFIRLIGNMLQAGYLENWRYHRTFSGTPQGGVVSPVLANIYLDRLDKHVEQTLLKDYNRGEKRKWNPTYRTLTSRAEKLRRAGRWEEAEEVRKQYQKLPSMDVNDADFRRLNYVRYADDFLLTFAGPQEEAEEIKRQLAMFLQDELKLELSESKTLITHARTEAARFLGYEISMIQCDTKRDGSGRRSVNGRIRLGVPKGVIRKHCQPYMAKGEAKPRLERQYDSAFSIVQQYQAEYRGLAEYYQLAINRTRLDEVRWVMQNSLLRTLAVKQRLTVTQVLQEYRAIIQTEVGPRKVLRVVVERGEGKKPLIAIWGGISLAHKNYAVLKDVPERVWNVGTELVQRLTADTCELCGSHMDVEVHHIRALKDLRPYSGQKDNKPEWVKVMAARHRKTLVVCRKCHVDIHAGRNPARKDHEDETSESRMR